MLSVIRYCVKHEAAFPTGVQPGVSQTSLMKSFAAIVNDLKPLSIVLKVFPFWIF